MQPLKRNYNRIVVKIGSSILSGLGEGIALRHLRKIVEQISILHKEGKQIILVSSGAIVCGMSLLGIKIRPTSLSLLQALAAVGQNELMNSYRRFFKTKAMLCAQVLLTGDDMSSRSRYINAKNTIHTLFRLKAIPIINENDTVSTEEIKFGDNDRLSALVASLTEADLLIILSDVDGLLNDKGEVIRLVEQVTAQIKQFACGPAKRACVGGMSTKITAAKIALDSGIPCVIANGKKDDVILLVVRDVMSCGTLFVPKAERLEARKRWIAFGARPCGKIFIDEGAREAIVKNYRSLLSPGIINVEGDFNQGDVVKILTRNNVHCANGIVTLASAQLKQIMGKKYHKEIIHRDNLVLIK